MNIMGWLGKRWTYSGITIYLWPFVYVGIAVLILLVWSYV